MSKSYELSEYQAGCLAWACNGENSTAYAVLEPIETDPPAKRTELDRYMQETLDLVHVGLVKDVSSMFTEQINLSKINNNRGYAVVAVTPVALMMFGPGQKGTA